MPIRATFFTVKSPRISYGALAYSAPVAKAHKGISYETTQHLTGGLWLVALTVMAKPPTPGYNQVIPPEILTPDTVKTSIGTLNFFDGLPDQDTVTKVYDNLDRMRATQAFLDMVPLASIEAMRRGMGVGRHRCLP